MKKQIAAFLLVATLSLLLVLPTAGAHRAAPPGCHEDPECYQVRLLHDNDEDWGGHSGSTRTKNGHDLLALDLRERWDAELGKVLEFSLVIEPGGWASVDAGERVGSPLKDVIHFTLNGTEHEYWFLTEDDETFTTNFARVEVNAAKSESDRSQPDGERRVLVGILPFETVAAAPGMTLDAVQAVGHHGQDQADVMGPDDPDASNAVTTTHHFVRDGYVLRGTGIYVDVELPTETVHLTLGEAKALPIDLTNTYETVAQNATLIADAPDGIVATLGSERGGNDDVYTLRLSNRSSGPDTLFLTLTAETRTQGELRLHVITSEGGYEEHVVPIEVSAASDGDGPGGGDDGVTDDSGDDADGDGTGSDNDTATNGSDNGTTDGNTEPTPAPNAALVLAALGLLLLVRRRS